MSSMVGMLNKTFTSPGLTWQGALMGPGLRSLTHPEQGTLFAKKTLTPAMVAPAPTVSNSQDALDVAAQQQQMGLQRGLTATMLTGGAGLSNMGTTSKTLLGG